MVLQVLAVVVSFLLAEMELWVPRKPAAQVVMVEAVVVLVPVPDYPRVATAVTVLLFSDFTHKEEA
jgi:hypothetical protein